MKRNSRLSFQIKVTDARDGFIVRIASEESKVTENLHVDDIGYDPFDVKVMTNPHPYYTRLRDERPVYYTPQYDTFWLSRFDDIVEMQVILNLEPGR